MSQSSDNADLQPGRAVRFYGYGLGLLFRHRDAMSALVVRGVGVLAGFLVTYWLGHHFGAAATGQYALLIQTAALLATAGLFGLDISVVRHFAKGIAEKRPIAWQLTSKVLAIGLGMMLLISLGLYLGGDRLWQLLFGDVVGRGMLLVLCLLLLGRGGAQLLGGLLRSQHRFVLSMAIVAIVIPGTSAIALATGIAGNVEQTLWATALGGTIALVLGTAIVFMRVGKPPAAITIPMRAIIASSLPLWGVGLAQVLGDWYGLAVAGQMLGAAEAGLFRVAVQFAAILQMLSATLYSVYSAQISTAFHAGRRDEVARLARTAVWIGGALSLPLTLLLVVGGRLILGWIGPEFVDAYPVVVILLVGQLGLALTGPCGLVLAMSGNERLNLYITLVSTALLLLSVPLAASYGGLTGIAACIATVMLARNLVAYLFVSRRLGIHIWAGTAKPLEQTAR